MHRSFRSCAIGTSLLFCALSMRAQPLVDIGLFPSSTPNTLEVRVRPDASFNLVVSEVTFTIRWENSSGASLNTAALAQFCQGGFSIAPSGDGQVVNGSFRYYTFSGFGFAQIASACPGQAWAANTERVIMTIPVTGATGCANFTIGNDAYTTANNKNFYMSLNGLERTDAIYSTVPVKVAPGDFNNSGQVNVSDFGILVNAFGTSCTGCATDMNSSGQVNVTDFGLFVNVFGNVCL
ncbi:MAG: hypothetical protein IPG69_10745 [Flavobacteriales bacterium]|jgi:hypothetical protein|nr:hypothetical protein [Flavobacteriales bacterium]MBK7271392.1 hypothetical protein [Flavobacteriales bacterium]MBK7751868.1 hypothetical protein [Flavobacteriales bacterium]MBK9074030.1 hypothetical protein [Flavobacteriales bacterium]MBK9539645.1 hypothetical protein [Flavobacteriales bacterium]